MVVLICGMEFCLRVRKVQVETHWKGYGGSL